MATMVSVKFGDVMLQLGDGETVEAYEDICGITAYDHDYNITTTTEDLPDCVDSNAVSFESPIKVSVGESISVQGIVSPTSHPLFRDLVYDPDETNIRLVFNKAPLAGHLQGPAIVTAAKGGSWERRKSGTFTGTLTFTAKPTWTAAGG